MAGGKRVVGLVCECRTRNLFNGSCAQLLELGVPVLGRYVQAESDRHDSYLVPRRTLIGRVAAIEDGMILDDHADGYDRIAATEAFSELRAEAFDDIANRKQRRKTWVTMKMPIVADLPFDS
jgi:hypothetical protein